MYMGYFPHSPRIMWLSMDNCTPMKYLPANISELPLQSSPYISAPYRRKDITFESNIFYKIPNTIFLDCRVKI